MLKISPEGRPAILNCNKIFYPHIHGIKMSEFFTLELVFATCNSIILVECVEFVNISLKVQMIKCRDKWSMAVN